MLAFLSRMNFSIYLMQRFILRHLTKTTSNYSRVHSGIRDQAGKSTFWGNTGKRIWDAPIASPPGSRLSLSFGLENWGTLRAVYRGAKLQLQTFKHAFITFDANLWGSETHSAPKLEIFIGKEDKWELHILLNARKSWVIFVNYIELLSFVFNHNISTVSFVDALYHCIYRPKR
jgi:hypothetical protein